MTTEEIIPLEERTDLQPTERRLWRTLVRVDSIDSDPATVYIVVPGWNPHEKVAYPLSSFPDEIQDSLQPLDRLFVHVNIGVVDAKDLYLDFNEYRLIPMDEFKHIA